MDFLIPNKLHSPYRTAYIERNYLSDRILANLERKLTLISAPAGFGKTYLALELAAKAEHRVKWYILDEHDASLKTFLTYLKASFFEDKAGVLTTNTSIEEAAAIVSKRLYDEQIPTLLILDGFHYVDDSKVVELVERLLSYLPPSCHILLTSRTQTSLNLAKMLVRQEVSVINERDLAFSAAEVEQLGCKVKVNTDFEELFTKTKGWPAAVSLSLSTGLQAHSDVIYDYIRGELLNGLDAEEEQTAYLVALAPSLNMREISALDLDVSILKKLEREHRLLTTDGSAYAFQPLLREGVLEYLKNDQPSVWTELNQKLGEALWENGFNEGLIYLAEAGSSYLAEALKSINFNILPGKVWKSLEPWLNSLSETDLKTMPLMLVLKADSLIFKDPDKALTYYEHALTTDLAGEARAAALVGRLRALTKVMDEQDRLETLALEAQKELNELKHFYHLARAKDLLAVYYQEQRKYAEAEALYLEIETIAENLENSYVEHLALFGLSSLSTVRGYAVQSLEYNRRVLSYQIEKGHRFGEAMALCAIASSHQMIGQAKAGEVHIEDAIHILKDIESKVNFSVCLYILFEIQVSLGHHIVAKEIFAELETHIDENSLIANYAHVIKSQLNIFLGELNEAQHSINKIERAPQASVSQILSGKLCLTKALLEMKKGNKKEVEEAITQSIKILRQADDRREETLALKVMSKLASDPVASARLLENVKELEKDLGYEVPLYILSNIINKASSSNVEGQASPSVVLKTLGELDIKVDTFVVPHSAWNGRKPKELFLFLADFSNGVPRDLIIEALWSDTELKAPEQQFSIALSRARRALGGRHMIIRKGATYMFNREIALDYDAASILKTSVNATTHELLSALELYKGSYLEGHYSDWVLSRRTELEEKVIVLTNELINRPAPTPENIYPFIKRAAVIDPTHQAFNSFLVKFYLASDKYRLAKKQLELYSDSLRELGAAPDPTVEALLS